MSRTPQRASMLILAGLAVAACGAPTGSGTSGAEPLETPPAVVTSPQPKASQSDLKDASLRYRDRRTIAFERAKDGTPEWWATTWTEVLDRGPEIVCVGGQAWVSCHDDVDVNLKGMPVELLSSGDSPYNGAIILVDPGVSDLTVTRQDGERQQLIPLNLETTSLRSVAGFGVSDDATHVIVSGVFDGSTFNQVVELASQPPLFAVEGLGTPVEHAKPDIMTVEHRPPELE